MYITFEDLVARYPIIETKYKKSSEVNSHIIYWAEHELNSRLATHFTVPFSAAHPTVKDLAIDLSYYRTLLTLDPDKAEKFKKAVIGRVDGIKAGDEYIYTDSGTVIATEGANDEIWSSTMDYSPTHSMLDAESEYTHISSDRLYDEENER